MSEAARIPQEVIDKAKGRAIAAVAFELGARWPGDRVVDEKGIACPGCGGVDRFSVNRAKNVFFCRMSGAGGGPIELVRHARGCGFREAVEHLTGKATLPAREAPRPPQKDDHFREKAGRRAHAIWMTGRSPLDLVPAYLRLRRIPLPDWRVRTIREIRELAYWHWSPADKEFRIIHRGPAMLAAITGADGRFIGVHRTWIDLERPNGKAVIVDPETGELLDAKKVEGTQRGGVVILREPDGRRPALRVALNLDNLSGKATESVTHPSRMLRDSLGRERRAKVAGPVPDLADDRCMPVPSGHFARAILLGDSDSDRFTTQAAMMRAERRFEAMGLAAEIDWAPPSGDFNDALRDGRAVSPVFPPASADDVAIGEGIETVLSWDAMQPHAARARAAA